MVVRFFAIAGSACAVLAADLPNASERSARPVYAVTENATSGRLLTRRDPATLSAIGPFAKLQSSSGPAAFSPDGSLLAFVQWNDDSPSIRVLELSHMRWRRAVPLSLRTGTPLVRWLDRRRLLVFAEQPDGLRVLTLDALTNRLSSASRIRGHLTDRDQVAAGRTRAAVLLRATQKIGPVRVAVVSATGSAHIVTLNQIREGVRNRETYRPALVADPIADRAYVVGGIRDPVAAVNLRTLAISYRRPFVSANADNVAGAERLTVWLGHGRFAVAGWDDGTPGFDSRLFGLQVVGTSSWRAQLLDRESDYFCVAGHFLVAHQINGTLVVFGFDGARRFALEPADAAFPAPVTSNDRSLYLTTTGDEALVVDLASGAIIGRRHVDGLQELISPTYTLGAGCR